AKLAEMSAARGELESQVGGFQQKMAELEQQLEQKGGRIRELTGMLDTLQSKVDQQSAAQTEAERAMAIQKEQNRQMSLRAQSFEYKAKRYDDVSSRIGEIVLEAEQNAREVLTAAEQKSEEIKRDAFSATEQAAGEMRSLRTDLGEIRRNIDMLMRSFNERLDAINTSIDQMDARRAGEAPAEPSVQTSAPSEEQPTGAAAEPVAARSFFRTAADA
ncbi:MAG: hypothetical protein RR197_07000, partial [Oscillospiraceae bacterium]